MDFDFIFIYLFFINIATLFIYFYYLMINHYIISHPQVEGRSVIYDRYSNREIVLESWVAASGASAAQRSRAFGGTNVQALAECGPPHSPQQWR